MSERVSYDEYFARKKRLQARYSYQFERMEALEIPFGWIGLVEDMCAHVDALLPKTLKKHFAWEQCKEKFGGGRFYWSCNVDDTEINESTLVGIREIIRGYELLASHTCFRCAQPARIVAGDWMSALCEKHEANMRKAAK